MAIYKNDIPHDLYAEPSESLRGLAAGVGLVCAEGQPIVTAHGLKLRSVQDYFKGVRIKGSVLAYPDRQDATLVSALGEEPAVWMVGTAFAVGRYQMLSAWHVVSDVLDEVDAGSDATKLRVVLGYSRATSASSSPKYKLLRVAKVTQLRRGGQALDVASIELTDPMPSSDAVLPVQKNVNHPRDADAVTLLGHPLGQPLKLTSGTLFDSDPYNDRSIAHARFSAAAANSGSPVLWNGKVLGVFTSADWPSEFAATTGGKWSHFFWDDESNGGNGYAGTVQYIGDLV